MRLPDDDASNKHTFLYEYLYVQAAAAALSACVVRSLRRGGYNEAYRHAALLMLYKGYSILIFFWNQHLNEEILADYT